MKQEPNKDEIYLKQLSGENNWIEICMYCNLSEEFMEEFAECLNWTQVSIHQKMSYNFIKKYMHKLNPNALLIYQKGMPIDLKMEAEKLMYQQMYKN